MNQKIKTGLRFLLFLGIGMAILYWLYTGQEAAYQEYCKLEGIPEDECDFLGKLISDFASVKWLWIVLMCMAYLASNTSRTIRWQMMLKSNGHPASFWIAFVSTMLGYFANSIIPRSGEIARAGYMSYKNDAPMEKVLGTIAVDRSIDIFSLAVVIGLGFLLEYDKLYSFLNENMGTPGGGLLSNPWIWAVGFVGIIIFVLGWFMRKRLQEIKLFRVLIEKAKGFLEGIWSVRKMEKPLFFLFHSLNIWFMYYCMMYIGFQSFAPTAILSPVVALVIFIFGTFGILVPSPGGVGAYQWLVTSGLMLYGIDKSDAFSFSNIAFWPIYLLNIGIGLILLPFTLGYFFSDKKEVEETN